MIKSFIRGEKDFVFGVLLSNVIFTVIAASFNMDIRISIYTLCVCTLFIGVKAFFSYLNFKELYAALNMLKDMETNVSGIEFPPGFKRDLLDVIKELRYRYRQVSDDRALVVHRMQNYFGTWAHQVKIPVQALSLLTDEAEMNREIIKTELLKIEDYVDMILGYFRLESETNDFLFARVDVSEIARRACKRYMRIFMLKGIKLEFEDFKLCIMSDPKWLSFMIEQVIMNALKYTFSGSVKISCSNNTLKIEDTGVGIVAQDMSRIFEMGYTGYNGRVYERSTGMGLALVKRAADLMNISLKVESEQNKGTKFYFIFNPKLTKM